MRAADVWQDPPRHPYYACQLPAIPPRHPAHDRQHPKSLWVREDALLEGISAFFATRVFGADRHAHLGAAFTDIKDEADQHQRRRRQALERALADNQRRQTRLVQTLEDNDTPAGTRQIRARLAELEAEHHTTTTELQALHQPDPTAPRPQATELLDQLPVGDLRLAEIVPEVLRRLFAAFHLEIVYDSTTRLARCRITLDEDYMPTLVARVKELIGTTAADDRDMDGRRRSHAVGALGRSPTSSMQGRQSTSQPRCH